MSDLATLINTLRSDGTIATIASNPLAQFGRTGRNYLGASLLPERLVEENAYREDSVRYRTIVANDGTRYSPTQKKAGDLIGSFLVELGESDISREFDSKLYDAVLRYIQSNQSMTAVASITNWLDTAVNLALVEHDEKQRWQAIVDASVVRVGDNEYSETVSYSNPAGHRAAQSAAWSTDSTDIFEDIFTMADLLASKGYTVNRMITSRTVLAKMAGNNTVKTRTGIAIVNTSGQITSAAGRAKLTPSTAFCRPMAYHLSNCTICNIAPKPVTNTSSSGMCSYLWRRLARMKPLTLATARSWYPTHWVIWPSGVVLGNQHPGA